MIDKLHYISQNSQGGTHLDAIMEVLDAGGKWIQLRIKNQPETDILEFAIKANALCVDYGARLIVNDHPHIAAQAGAYGVHLGLQDMPIVEARVIVGNKVIIGGTANTFEHIVQRVAEGADYIGLGPYRFTSTKQNLSPIIGLQGYESMIKRAAQAGIRIPIIAIGGIEQADVSLLMNTGIYGVAVSGALTNRGDLAEQISAIQEELQILHPINL
ncbi:MAG TPA: thiamine phosphate synthase [Pedobacter sp.]|uniref:thiamine phosphate synthase n=1 Tax=Pedobacter sp. TaxID=1411316 RepID=UPI002BE7CF1C|nr:thiamine phosphate synthase [Pedobacter sp.]HMI01990.1 thiamine phosphate synthase [Pedobacter sp.]